MIPERLIGKQDIEKVGRMRDKQGGEGRGKHRERERRREMKKERKTERK